MQPVKTIASQDYEFTKITATYPKLIEIVPDASGVMSGEAFLRFDRGMWLVCVPNRDGVIRRRGSSPTLHGAVFIAKSV